VISNSDPTCDSRPHHRETASTGAPRRHLQVTSVKTFLAVFAYALSLFGIDVGSHVRTDRVQDHGTDVLYSQVVTRPGGTRFECVRSASGQCYYTVFADACRTVPGTGAADCTAQPPQRFALARGGTRQMAALPTLRMCVSTDAGAGAVDCE